MTQALSDPEKRKIYDQFGEEGLKQGVPPPGAGGFDAGNGFPGGFPGGGSTQFRWQPRAANDIFSEVSAGTDCCNMPVSMCNTRHFQAGLQCFAFRCTTCISNEHSTPSHSEEPAGDTSQKC